MVTRAYSICRVCTAVYPAERGCPVCDGDQQSAVVVAAATAHAVELTPSPRPPRRGRTIAALGVLVTIALVLGAAVAAIAGSRLADGATDTRAANLAND